MSKIVKIYCEGKKGSHDFDILDKVVHALPVQIEPIGSIRGAGAIIQFKESEIVKSDFKILFRDRDFDLPIPSDPKLEQDPNRKYCYFSYRNTIENYLFDPSVMFSFLKEKNINAEIKLDSEKSVKELFIQVAETIKYYQAVRHTLGKMRVNIDFGTKLTDKSGVLPKKLDEASCKDLAFNKIEYERLKTEAWSRDEFEKVYSGFIEMFSPTFMNKLEFLVYFQGKDFAASLQGLIPGFPIKPYFKYAKQHFDYNNFEDLVELRKLVANAINA